MRGIFSTNIGLADCFALTIWGIFPTFEARPISLSFSPLV